MPSTSRNWCVCKVDVFLRAALGSSGWETVRPRIWSVIITMKWIDIHEIKHIVSEEMWRKLKAIDIWIDSFEYFHVTNLVWLKIVILTNWKTIFVIKNHPNKLAWIKNDFLMLYVSREFVLRNRSFQVLGCRWMFWRLDTKSTAENVFSSKVVRSRAHRRTKP